MWFGSEEQHAQLIFNSKVAVTASVFRSDTSHALIKLSENWFQQGKGKPALGATLFMDRGHSISEKVSVDLQSQRGFLLYNVSNYFQK